MDESFNIMGVIVLNLIFLYLLINMFSEWLRMRYKNRMYKELLNKFQGGQELGDFLNNESGSRFINTFSIHTQQPKEKIIASVIKGVVITLLGISLVVIGLVYPEYQKHFVIFGIIGTAVGIGFLVSSFLTYRLSMKWDIFE